jgi:hypothetical protein
MVTPAEYARTLERFRRLLETIVAGCERNGTLPVLVIPPSNDSAFEPSRSVLPETANAAERAEIERQVRAGRAVEAIDPVRAIATYETILGRWPRFAEAHYRLARLLEREGDSEQARRHDVAARDVDGLIIRCPTDFQDVYREVAARHDVVLVDGPSVLRVVSPTGRLDYHVFHDMHHPTLVGHTALAEAVLRGLHARRALGWPEGPSPRIDPAACAEHFEINTIRWRDVCDQAAGTHRYAARHRYDPSERLAWARRFEQASRALAAGRRPEDTGVPGVTALSGRARASAPCPRFGIRTEGSRPLSSF